MTVLDAEAHGEVAHVEGEAHEEDRDESEDAGDGKECWGLATLALDRGAPGEGKGGDELVFDALQLEAENGVHRYVGRARRRREGEQDTRPATTRENARLREEDHGGEALVEEMAGRRLQGFQIVRRPGEQVVAQVLVRKLTTLELGGGGGLAEPDTLVTIAALYLLGIMYFIGQGGFRRVLAGTDINEIELLALQRGGKKGSASRVIARADSAAAMTDAPSAASEASASVSEEGVEGKDAAIADPLLCAADTVGTQAESGDRAQGAPHSASSGSTAATRDGAAFRDRFSKQMAAVREFYGLSAREAEVAELIARGNTVAHIAELLFVSENTVRTHSKRIYVKLDIHKRQELIALVESFEPEGR